MLPNTASSEELDEYLRLPFLMSHPSSDSSSNFQFVLQHLSVQPPVRRGSPISASLSQVTSGSFSGAMAA